MKTHCNLNQPTKNPKPHMKMEYFTCRKRHQPTECHSQLPLTVKTSFMSVGQIDHAQKVMMEISTYPIEK